MSLPVLPAAPNLRLAALALAITDVMAKRAAAADKAVRASVASGWFLSGEHAAVLDPETLQPIGTARRNAATRKAEVTNLAALTEWIDEQDVKGSAYDGGTVQSATPVTGDPEDVLAVLEQHAPHLLGERRVIATDWAVNQATAAALDGQDIPGVDVVSKQGSIVVELDQTARDRLYELATTGVVDPAIQLPPVDS